MDFNKFSFRGIQDLCRVHQRDIYLSLDREKLKAVLEDRRVRFISPLGYFDYAYFGEFTFDGNVMILWTKKSEYTRFHKSGLDSNTLWSLVPVIYAGIETKNKDDQNQEIFSGDVVSCKGYTSFVRYFGESTVPGLAENLYWPRGQFVPSGLSRDEVIERAAQANKQPTFADDFQPQRRGRELVYQDISEILREGDVLCYFVGNQHDEEGKTVRNVYADNIPDNYTREEYTIELGITEHYYDSIMSSVGQFLQYAHERPEKTFILCDFKNALAIREYEEQRTALQFLEWYEYNIPNVIMPFWIFNNLAGLDMIGRD